MNPALLKVVILSESAPNGADESKDLQLLVRTWSSRARTSIPRIFSTSNAIFRPVTGFRGLTGKMQDRPSKGKVYSPKWVWQTLKIASILFK